MVRCDTQQFNQDFKIPSLFFHLAQLVTEQLFRDFICMFEIMV